MQDNVKAIQTEIKFVTLQPFPLLLTDLGYHIVISILASHAFNQQTLETNSLLKRLVSNMFSEERQLDQETSPYCWLQGDIRDTGRRENRVEKPRFDVRP